MSEPLFDTVAIVGVGLLGGSFGMDLRARSLARRVLGVVRRAESAAAVLERGAADEVTTDLSELERADLIVLAAPVQAIIDGMASIAAAARPDAIVTDMGSTKAEIVRAGEAALGSRFVGGHPMAGSHHSGVAAAREGLFQNATWVFTPTSVTPPESLDRLSELARAVGANTVTLDTETHDRIAAAVSHMPHVAACAVSLAVSQLADGDARFGALAAGGLRDMTRLAASPASLWQDIIATNRYNTKQALESLRAALDNAIESMETDEGIGDLFSLAATARAPLVREG